MKIQQLYAPRTLTLTFAVFTGDASFIEDFGSGRCDFPRVSADAPFDSAQRLDARPDATLLAPRILLRSAQVNINAGALPRGHRGLGAVTSPTTSRGKDGIRD